ncbi:MAG: c-type cytochrome [Verrucomicrobiota bacterium]|nr:c-type cytochrome [Verrucomicrobiota bacterium]
MLKRFLIALAICSAAPHLSAQVDVRLEALKRLKDIDLEANPAIKKVVLDTLESLRGQAAFVEIVRDFKLPGHEAELLRYAQAHPGDSIGVEAIRLSLNDAGLKLIDDAIDGPHATGTVTALANAQMPEAGPVLLRLAKEAKKPLALRTIAVNGLAKAKPGAQALLAEAKAGRLPADLQFAVGNALRGVRWNNLRAQATKLFPPPQGLGQALPPLAKLVAIKGNIANGEKVFFRPQSTCASCHQVNGRGIDFGPKLSGIGTKLGREALLLSILDPSAGIPFGYEAWLLKTKNGAEALGIITSQTDDEVTLKLPGGITITYKAADITKRTQLPTSIMPPGLQATMTPQELVDLVSYMHSLKQAKP